MKGLLRNNLIAAYANAKVFFVFMLLFGVFAAAVVSQSLQISYGLTGIVGFSVNAALVTKNEFTSKWGNYKLTLPVKRADIIKSLFGNLLIWLLAGTLLSGIEISLSWLLHGCPFDQPIDILTIFALGVSVSFFMGSLFFPLFCLGGEERSEMLLVISLLCAAAIDFVIVSVLNDLLTPGDTAVVFGAAALLACSLLAFALSCPLTVRIYKQKDF